MRAHWNNGEVVLTLSVQEAKWVAYALRSGADDVPATCEWQGDRETVLKVDRLGKAVAKAITKAEGGIS